jgi:NitT/TauT family transport system permease protein
MDPGDKPRDDTDGASVGVVLVKSASRPPMITRPEALRRMLPATMMFIGFVAVWQLAVSGLGVREYLLPSPLAVLQAMGPGEIPWSKHIWITAVEIVGAFLIAALAGVLLGAAIAWSQGVSRALTPFLVFVNTLPKVAIAPLFLIWLGYGILPNMLIGALIGFFPVVINTAVGLTQIEQDMLDLGRVFNAPNWKVFAKIRMPNAYPYILSALKVTATSAVVGAVVGEFVASQAGLGYVIITTQSSMNTPVAFAALAWISILGLLLFGAVGLMSRVLAPWAEVLDR